MDVDGSGTMKFNGTNGDSRRVGVLYDERMCKHHTPDGDYHPENPNRIRVIWNKLQTAGILQRHDRFCFFISFFFFFFPVVYLLYTVCSVAKVMGKKKSKNWDILY